MNIKHIKIEIQNKFTQNASLAVGNVRCLFNCEVLLIKFSINFKFFNVSAVFQDLPDRRACRALKARMGRRAFKAKADLLGQLGLQALMGQRDQ